MQLRSGKSIGITVQEMLRCEEIHLRKSFGCDIYRKLKRKIKKREKELDRTMYNFVNHHNFTTGNNSYLRYFGQSGGCCPTGFYQQFNQQFHFGEGKFLNISLLLLKSNK